MRNPMLTASCRRGGTRSKLPVLLIASLVCSLIMLDSNIVAVSLPPIARSLHATFADIEWVVSAYILPFAALLLASGSFADRHGRKRAILIGLVVFTVASVLCSLSTSAIMLNLSRVLQGVGASVLLPAALAVINHAFAGSERAKAYAFWGACVGIVIATGPIVGGLITTFFGWRFPGQSSSLHRADHCSASCDPRISRSRSETARPRRHRDVQLRTFLTDLGIDRRKLGRLDHDGHSRGSRGGGVPARALRRSRGPAGASHGRLEPFPASDIPRVDLRDAGLRRSGAGHDLLPASRKDDGLHARGDAQLWVVAKATSRSSRSSATSSFQCKEMTRFASKSRTGTFFTLGASKIAGMSATPMPAPTNARARSS
jgi:hypothetical protein